MADAVRMYVAGAFMDQCLVEGRPNGAPSWRRCNVVLTEGAVELAERGARSRVPLAEVTAVSGLVSTLPPPPLEFDQCVLIHHKDARGRACASAVAFPRVTVGNFPLELAAALLGTIAARLPQGSGADARYEDVWLSYARGRFEVRRRVGAFAIPLEAVAGLSDRRVRAPDGREAIEFTIDFVQGDQVRPISFVAYDRLAFLQQLLAGVRGLRRNVAAASGASADALSEMTQQVAVVLYTSGATTSQVEQLLGIPPAEVDRIYEELLKLGLAEVVKVRKEIQINAAGAKLVADIMKKQMQLAG